MIRLQSSLPTSLSGEATRVVFAFEKSKRPVGAFLFGSSVDDAYARARKDGFRGELGQTTVVHSNHRSPERIVFTGLGDETAVTVHTLRRAAAIAARKSTSLGAPTIAVRLPDIGQIPETAQAATEGVLLGTYAYRRYKSKAEDERPLRDVRLIATDRDELRRISAGIERGVIFSDAVAFVRDLVNQGPSDTTPANLVTIARNVARGSVRVRVYGKSDLARMGMGGLLGVNRGSAQPPYFLHWTYKPKGKIHRRIGICGKGITFDSGGLSLKPAKSMETMKTDMAGAAVVFAVFRALAKLRPAVEVHGFTPLTENMPGGNAIKPGDILRSFNGKTIEVLNTDAEGRLVLSDALGFASKQPLDEIIDLATLTGACVVALGNSITAVLGSNRELIGRLRAAAEINGEKLWELPLEEEYRSHFKSHVADVKNIGQPGVAGTIIGGLFLQEFVNPKIAWAHLDIAGTAWTDNGTDLSTPGGTGAMTRTLLHYILSLDRR